MHAITLVFGVLAAVRADTIPPLRDDPVEGVIAELRDWVPAVLARDHVPGMAIALIRQGQVVWVGGFGVTNSLTRTPVGAETVFPVASLGKPATAHAALRLAGRSELALDRPLASALSGQWLGDEAPITLRHVLAHTSGLSNFLGDRTRRPRFTPGERFEYSGVGFMYLQHVLETVAREPLDSVVARETFRPLGMERSWFGSLSAGIEDVAAGHIPIGRAVVPFGIVFLPLWLLGLGLGSVASRLARKGWRPSPPIRLAVVSLAAASTVAFLYSKAANPRLVPFFVVAFAVYALISVGLGRLAGVGRLRGVRVPLAIAAAVAIFALARLWPMPIPHGGAPRGNAASSLRATAGDLARLAIELGRPSLLDSTMGRELLADQAKAAAHVAWGLGIGIQRAPGADAVFHWGRNPSARAAMVFYPESGTGVVVLANGGTAGDAVGEVALRAIGGPAYWVDE